jgi:branched-chain amino acid transport system ATP-binding protein
MRENILDVLKLTKSFGGLTAIDKVDFTVPAASVVGLIGPNGSGKTTLLNLIAGRLQPETGKVFFEGSDITGKPPHKRAHIGIARTFQVPRPLQEMTVAENIRLAYWFGRERKSTESKGGIESEVDLVCQFVGLSTKREHLAGNLNVVDRKRLELARALSMKPKLLLLDEVMAGLNLKEMEDVINLLKKMNSQGVTIVIVEHIMKAIVTISQRVTVLYQGCKIAEGPPRAVFDNPRVIEAYLGLQSISKRDPCAEKQGA